MRLIGVYSHEGKYYRKAVQNSSDIVRVHNKVSHWSGPIYCLRKAVTSMLARSVGRHDVIAIRWLVLVSPQRDDRDVVIE